jgi:6-phosphogluconolactonase (cycloisomerase 2 family)
MKKTIYAGTYTGTGSEGIYTFSFENGILSADFTPVINAKLIMSAPAGMLTPHVYEEDEVKEITHVEFDLNNVNRPGAYVRLQITDKNGLDAWCNPFRLK